MPAADGPVTARRRVTWQRLGRGRSWNVEGRTRLGVAVGVMFCYTELAHDLPGHIRVRQRGPVRGVNPNRPSRFLLDFRFRR